MDTPSGSRRRSSNRVLPVAATFWHTMLMVGRLASSSSLRMLSWGQQAGEL